MILKHIHSLGLAKFPSRIYTHTQDNNNKTRKHQMMYKQSNRSKYMCLCFFFDDMIKSRWILIFLGQAERKRNFVVCMMMMVMFDCVFYCCCSWYVYFGVGLYAKMWSCFIYTVNWIGVYSSKWTRVKIIQIVVHINSQAIRRLTVMIIYIIFRVSRQMIFAMCGEQQVICHLRHTQIMSCNENVREEYRI